MKNVLQRAQIAHSVCRLHTRTQKNRDEIVKLLFRKVPMLLKCHTSSKSEHFHCGCSQWQLFAAVCWLTAAAAAAAMAADDGGVPPMPLWLNIESVCVFFSHSHFACLFFVFCFVHSLEQRGLQKHWMKTHCYYLNCTLPRSFTVLFGFRYQVNI